MLPRAAGALEYLDRPLPQADREAELADIHRLNAWFGGYWLSERAIRRLTAGAALGVPLRVIDVGGGPGRLATRLAQRGRSQGRRVRVIVVDRSFDLGPAPGGDVVLVVADATALPFREAAADVVTACLTLHHLEPDAAARCLGEMRAAARLGVVVNDLLRTRLTLGLVWLATRLFARRSFACHDGPVSVRRAYAPAEIETLAGRAGIRDVTIRRYAGLGRLVAVLR